MFIPALSCFALLVYLTGLFKVNFLEENYCAMTYMFEYPQYVRIPVEGEEEFTGYGLYAYSEGRLTERARKMWFDGVPVLFLPGNSGSHMQARSLASIALRMAISKGAGYHFDYFTVSFNEDASGLFGGVLKKQVAYASKAIDTILNLYKNKPYIDIPPEMVVIIGHSMGGVIAKKLMVDPVQLKHQQVVIALASPLLAPVVNFDELMDEFYKEMDYDWSETIRSNKELRAKKTLLSFGGGSRDLLVPAGLTADNDSFISALTTAIPGVWVSTDHVGIVWCKQVILKLNRFLFSIVDRSTQQVHQNMRLIRAQAKTYFESNRSMTYDLETPHVNAMMIPDAFWYEDNRRVYQISRPSVEKTSYLMIRLVDFPQNRFVAIESVNVSDKDWVFGCNAKEVYHHHRYCKTATSLSHLSRWTGSAFYKDKRKLATIDLHDLAKKFPDWTHVVVKISPTRKPVTLNVDVNDHASRVLTVEYPALFGFGYTTVINRTEPGVLYYEIKLKDFTHAKQVLLLLLEPSRDCKASSYHVSAEIHIPWAKNNEYVYYYTKTGPYAVTMRLLTSKPKAKHYIHDHVTVTMLLDPKCTFRISIMESWHLAFAEMVRNYTSALIPYMVGILLLALRNILINIERKGYAMSIHKALNQRILLPYVAIPTILALTLIYKLVCFWTDGSFMYISSAMKNDEMFEAFLELTPMTLMYMTALGSLHVFAAVIQVTLIFFSQVTHKLFFRIVWAGASSIGEGVETVLLKVPFVVSLMLVVTAGVARGSASLVIGAAFYAFMLSKMYEEYWNTYMLKTVGTLALRLFRIIFGVKQMKLPENYVPRAETTSEHNPPAERTDTETKSNENTRPQDDGFYIPEEVTVSEVFYEEPDEQLSCFNFHLVLFLLWLVSTIIHIPSLLTWARYFPDEPKVPLNFSVVLNISMALCTLYLFQMRAPRQNLRTYNALVTTILIIAAVVLTLGPTCLFLVDHLITVALMFIVGQQVFDTTDGNFLRRAYFDDCIDPVLIAEYIRNCEFEPENVSVINQKENEVIGSEDEASALPRKASLADTTASSSTASLPAKPSSADSSTTASPNPSTSTTSTTNDEHANLAEPNNSDVDRIMLKMRNLKEKISHLEQM